MMPAGDRGRGASVEAEPFHDGVDGAGECGGLLVREGEVNGFLGPLELDPQNHAPVAGQQFHIVQRAVEFGE